MSNELLNEQKSLKTPIETLLAVDENGMTTTKKLYEFLELDPTHYSRWCKKYITNNPMVIKGEDYIACETAENEVLATEGENLQNKGGRPLQDYKISANLAKKLAMISNSPKGEEARDYFIGCETKDRINRENQCFGSFYFGTE